MKSLQAIRKTAIVGFFTYFSIFYGLLLAFPEQRTFISDLLSPIGIIFSLGLIGWSMKWHNERYKKTWLAFWLGGVIYLFGELLWFYYEIILKQEVLFPSICDAFYLLSTVYFFIGVALYINVKNIYGIFRVGFDILITMVALVTLCWQYVLMPIYHDPSLGAMAKLVSLCYPIIDISYLAGVLYLFLTYPPDKKKSNGDILIATAFLIWFITDQIYSVENNLGIYKAGSLIDPLWIIGAWFLGTASLWTGALDSDVDMKSAGRPPSDREGAVVRYVRILLPYITTCILSVVAGMKYFTKDPLIAGIVITVFLVIVRQVFSLLENERLIFLIKQSNQALAVSKQELEAQNIELQKLNHLKEQEAQTDFLTGLYNRRCIDRQIKTLSEETQMNHQYLSLLLADIDNFKQINDQWGHDVGDMVLQGVSESMKGCIRSLDIAGRFGGDEFIIILPDADLSTAKTISERLRRQIANKQFMFNNISLNITLSIGGTQWQKDNLKEDIKSMIFRADAALYQAKSAGRNQTVVTM